MTGRTQVETLQGKTLRIVFKSSLNQVPFRPESLVAADYTASEGNKWLLLENIAKSIFLLDINS